VASLREDVEDLKDPVEEFDLFDQCMFTIGVTQYGETRRQLGVLLRPGRPGAPAGAGDGHARVRPPAIRLPGLPREEPPQIECNEDAGGQGTDE
jgi:hypothetical protein